MIGLTLVALLLAVVFEAAEQVCWRMNGRAGGWAWKWLGWGIATHIAHLAAWIGLLKLIPLSVALPLTGLDYIVVALVSARLFGEKMDRRRWVGTWLIVLGVVLIGSGGWS